MQVDWIALATSATQADDVLRATIGLGWDVTLVAAGPAVTKEAQARGLTVGFVACVALDRSARDRNAEHPDRCAGTLMQAASFARGPA